MHSGKAAFGKVIFHGPHDHRRRRASHDFCRQAFPVHTFEFLQPFERLKSHSKALHAHAVGMDAADPMRLLSRRKQECRIVPGEGSFEATQGHLRLRIRRRQSSMVGNVAGNSLHRNQDRFRPERPRSGRHGMRRVHQPPLCQQARNGAVRGHPFLKPSQRRVRLCHRNKPLRPACPISAQGILERCRPRLVKTAMDEYLHANGLACACTRGKLTARMGGVHALRNPSISRPRADGPPS